MLTGICKILPKPKVAGSNPVCRSYVMHFFMKRGASFFCDFINRLYLYAEIYQ